MAAALVGLTLFGLWIDHKFGTGPVGVLCGAGLGTIGGMYNFIRTALRLGQESTTQSRRPDEPDKSESDDTQ